MSETLGNVDFVLESRGTSRDLGAWVVGAARRVQDQYGGDASAIWADGPSRPELAERLEAFDGIGATKARKAVDAVERAGFLAASPEE